MRRSEAGVPLVRSGWISGFFWVLGMGSRMAFLVWIANGGSGTIASFSAHHSITSAEAWTVALLGMAVAEVLGRTSVLALRSRRITDRVRAGRGVGLSVTDHVALLARCPGGPRHPGIRLVLVSWTVINSDPGPGTSGRGLVIGVLLAVGVLGWIIWAWQAYTKRIAAVDLFALSAAGALLVGAAPNAAGSAFAFVAIVSGGFRLPFRRAIAITVVGLVGLALGVLVYDRAAVVALAYGLGFIASLLAGANARQAARQGRGSRAAAGAGAALPRGATSRSASAGIRSDRAGDPRRPRSHPGWADDPAGGDRLAA